MANNKSNNEPISHDEDLLVSRLMMIMITSSSDLVFNQNERSPTAAMGYNNNKKGG